MEVKLSKPDRNLAGILYNICISQKVVDCSPFIAEGAKNRSKIIAFVNAALQNEGNLI